MDSAVAAIDENAETWFKSGCRLAPRPILNVRAQTTAVAVEARWRRCSASPHYQVARRPAVTAWAVASGLSWTS